MAEAEDLERQLLKKGAAGTRDQYWEAASRRWAIASAALADGRPPQKDLSLAAIFAGKAFGNGDRDNVERLHVYAAILTAAREARCLPSDLVPIHAKVTAALRRTTGTKAPTIIARAKKRIWTHTAGLTICDSLRWQSLFHDPDVSAEILAGHALFVDTGADGTFDVDVRVLDSGEPDLSSRDLGAFTGASSATAELEVPSGVLRITGRLRVDEDDAGDLPSRSFLDFPMSLGTYCARMFHLQTDAGTDKIVVVLAPAAATRTDRPAASNDGKPARDGCGPGLLVLP
jgi:hypothetical protein